MCTIKDSILLRDLPLCNSLIGELVCFYMSYNSNTSPVELVIKRKYSTVYKVKSIDFDLESLMLPKNYPLENCTFELLFQQYLMLYLKNKKKNVMKISKYNSFLNIVKGLSKISCLCKLL